MSRAVVKTRYHLRNGLIQDWVQLPTPEERKQWEKRNTKPKWVVKTKMIVTPTEEQIYEYERLDD